METNLIENLSVLTTIPKDALDKLQEKAVWCICDSVEDAVLAGEVVFSIDVGIGQLIITDEDNTIKYKFVPSRDLEDSVRDTILNRKNPLKYHLEKSLVGKIMNTYKTIV
jgi:hypothetical protein